MDNFKSLIQWNLCHYFFSYHASEPIVFVADMGVTDFGLVDSDTVEKSIRPLIVTVPLFESERHNALGITLVEPKDIEGDEEVVFNYRIQNRETVCPLPLFVDKILNLELPYVFALAGNDTTVPGFDSEYINEWCEQIANFEMDNYDPNLFAYRLKEGIMAAKKASDNATDKTIRSRLLGDILRLENVLQGHFRDGKTIKESMLYYPVTDKTALTGLYKRDTDKTTVANDVEVAYTRAITLADDILTDPSIKTDFGVKQRIESKLISLCYRATTEAWKDRCNIYDYVTDGPIPPEATAGYERFVDDISKAVGKYRTGDEFTSLDISQEADVNLWSTEAVLDKDFAGEGIIQKLRLVYQCGECGSDRWPMEEIDNKYRTGEGKRPVCDACGHIITPHTPTYLYKKL